MVGRVAVDGRQRRIGLRGAQLRVPIVRLADQLEVSNGYVAFAETANSHLNAELSVLDKVEPRRAPRRRQSRNLANKWLLPTTVLR